MLRLRFSHDSQSTIEMVASCLSCAAADLTASLASTSQHFTERHWFAGAVQAVSSRCGDASPGIRLRMYVRVQSKSHMHQRLATCEMSTQRSCTISALAQKPQR
jgi:hypothetical protein